METQVDGKPDTPQTRRGPQPQPNAGAVYGLGMIGALVWFWSRADGAGSRLRAVLRAMVWPAFLVYEAFRTLDGDK